MRRISFFRGVVVLDAVGVDAWDAKVLDAWDAGRPNALGLKFSGLPRSFAYSCALNTEISSRLIFAGLRGDSFLSVCWESLVRVACSIELLDPP